MQISLIGLFFLFAAFQALLLLIGINVRQAFNTDLKKITSILLLDIFLVTLYYVLILQSLKLPFLGIFGNIAWMSLCPLYFLMIRSLTTLDWTLNYKAIKYFSIPILFLLEGILGWFKINLWAPLGIINSDSYLDLWMFLFFTSAAYFMFKSIYLLMANDTIEKNRDLNWFTILFTSSIFVFAVTYLIVRAQYTMSFEITLIGLLSIFVFLLIYRVFKILAFQKFFDQKNKNKSKLSKGEIRAISKRLEEVMNDKKPYLDSSLTLNSLSLHTNINSSELSRLFSEYYNSNFYEFINRYRVDHLENLILDNNYAHFKITALAEKSGFKSKATFYKAFKEKHQLTPLQFIKKHRT